LQETLHCLYGNEKKMLRIGLITTVNSNIGDDFIREGICLVLRQVFRGRDLEFVPVHKHRPMTVYPGWHPCRWTELLPRGRRYAYTLAGGLFSRLGHSRFDDCDLIVQCGAPVFWPGCHSAEWAEPLWRQVLGRLSRRLPVLNLAAGSCYAWERQPSGMDDPLDRDYMQRILGYCRLTTVRDVLAQKLCASVGVRVPLVRCSAFLAALGRRSALEDSGPILINYMPGGGHFDWDQHIDAGAWRKTVQDIMMRLQQRHRLVFLCHNRKEYEAALDLDADIPRIWPQTPQEYFEAAATAKAALCNRMHAAVGLAGLGIPSIAVGTDTRLLMVAAVGLPHHYVKGLRAARLEEELEGLVAARRSHQERLLAAQDQTFSTYTTLVTQALEGLPVMG
jgi:hypothetical protein